MSDGRIGPPPHGDPARDAYFGRTPWTNMATAAAVADEPHIERVRRLIEQAYLDHPTGCGGSFGEILCHEIHTQGLTFAWLAEKWGISLAMLGELIADHCRRLEEGPRVDHDYRKGER